ncbi:MAG: hypothetical protein K2Y18_07540 [Alphaproteobacteria bacterium]|jgi:hypothetical protein|nr:hypothetical protein [Alphaproteobacteria bacterium]
MQITILKNMVGVSIAALIVSSLCVGNTVKNQKQETETSKPNVTLSEENHKLTPPSAEKEKGQKVPTDTPQVRVKDRLDLLEIESEDGAGTEDDMALSARGGIRADSMQTGELELVTPQTQESEDLQNSREQLQAAQNVNDTTTKQVSADFNGIVTPIDYQDKSDQGKANIPDPEDEPTDEGDRAGGEHKGRPKMVKLSNIPIIKMGGSIQENNGLTVIKTWAN